jgi:predicted HTH domain antitoxin
MSANQFKVTLPNEFMPFILQLKDGNTTDEKVSLSLAIGMFLSKQTTLAKSAELAKKTIWEFVDVLRSQGISWGEYTEDSLMMDELTLSKIAGVG